MDATTQHRIATEVKQIAASLIDRDYLSLEQRCQGVRLSAADIKRAVEQYGRTIAFIPDAEWSRLDVISVSGTSPPRYSVRVDLWTEEEGRSDLTLELTLIDHGSAFTIEIDDLHVL